MASTRLGDVRDVWRWWRGFRIAPSNALRKLRGRVDEPEESEDDVHVIVEVLAETVLSVRVLLLVVDIVE